MAAERVAAFEYAPFSLKQQMVLGWWMPGSPYHKHEMLIAEGAIRSGKTVSMIESFLTWSMTVHRNQKFIIAGRSMGALRKNVLGPLFEILAAKQIAYRYNRSDNVITIGTNKYFCYGAPTESSQDVLQGLTAAGAYADEAALLPANFVKQMIARCSVKGRRYFMNCNPEGPYHWFKTEYIDQAKKKRAVVLHFDMDDNLSLDEDVKAGYYRMFSGVFFKRYILGLWVMAEGVIYDMFNEDRHVIQAPPLEAYEDFYVSIDYGTMNPAAFGLWGKYGKKWIKVKEYHYDGRTVGSQKTDAQYSRDLQAFTEGIYLSGVVVDPSAASFIAQLEEDGFIVIEGNNDVLDGIRNVQQALAEELVAYSEECTETKREFQSYAWDEKAAKKRGEDRPIKQNDHQMDADRYFIRTIIFEGSNAFYSSVNAF